MSQPVRYSIRLEDLHDKVEEMAAFEAAVEQTLHHLDQVVSGLHLTWTGEAAVAHVSAHQRWATGMVEMHDALTVIRAAAARAHANYARAVEANAGMWSTVR